MLNSDEEKAIIVVASPGYQVLLNVGNDCLTIDAFNPVNLSQLYNTEILSKCGSLATHLRDGHLIMYTGENLPKDPNTQRINALRNSTAQHIEAQFSQTAQDSNHPDMQIETKAVNVNETNKVSLQQQVTESREASKKVESRLRANIAKEYEHSASVTSDPARTVSDPDTKDLLKMKVSFDVDPKVFAAKQEASRKKLDTIAQQEEDDAQNEINQIESKEETGGK
jgi:hypothetical protein